MPRHNSFAALLVLFFFVALAGCRKKDPPAVRASEIAPVQADLITVEARPFAATVAVTGTLVSNARVDVKAEIIGRVSRFPKDVGDPVAQGEPVVWIDDENYRLALRQAETVVQVSEASLERANVLEAHSRQELERSDNLVKSGGITDKDLKATRVTEQDAKAQVALAHAQLDQAKAALEVARKKLRDTIIHAPVAGEIQKKWVNVGAYVEAPTALFTVVDNRRLELESPVSTADLAPIRPGQPVTFTINSYPGRKFEGRVMESSPAVETETRSAKVRIHVPNPAGRLKAGMFAEGEILIGVTAQSIVVPAAAVYRNDRSAKDSYVFVVDGGKAVRRAIRIGRERDAELEIVSGLKPGDVLIAEQSIEIAEGVRVEARK